MQAIIANHIEAVNAFDIDAIADTFADGALVNDNRREFWGKAAIRAWIAKEIVGDKVTMRVTEARERGDEAVVRARYDGTYDKTNLPAELILTNYFRVEGGKIKTLIVIRNQA
ncbi:MAG TPA: nuclear transport factor 2 family protein [Kofleriaceae bacterium]|jgi:ketosteroid isomerase-like protein|nr:nuclear transport factor 2 family protein [Kofleriaceae bacterium]